MSPATNRLEADRRTVAQRQHDALSAPPAACAGHPKLGQHNGLPVTVIVSASLQDLQAQTGMAMTGGGTQLPISDVIRMASHSYHYLSIFDGVSGRRLYADHACVGSIKTRPTTGDRGCLHPGRMKARRAAARSIMLEKDTGRRAATSMIWPSPAGRTTGWSNTTGGPPENAEMAAPNGYRLYSYR